jgi:penicillin-binding protein 2
MFTSQLKKSEIRNFYKEKKIFRRGALVVCLFFTIFLALIVYRLFDLQIIHHNIYSTASNSNILSQSPIAPKRGLIYDRNGQLLAGADPVYTLTLIPDHTKNLDETIKHIQHYITITPHDLQSFYLDLERHHKSDPVVLKYNVSEADADIIYAHRIDFPSLQISLGLKRVYPYHNATSHVVGYVGRITTSDQAVLNDPNYAASSFVGRTGVEKYFEAQLHGQSGIIESEVNAAGKIIHQNVIKPAIAGENISLSIDIRLQKAITTMMGNRSGSVVVVNPNNGEVLALVSTPTFDPNDFVSGLTTDAFNTLNSNPHFPLVNRAIHGDFSPGSTIKPFYSYYALYKGWLTIDDSIQDPGWFQLPGTKHIFHDDRPGNYGWVNVTKAIILSSDTFFYNLANQLGISKLHEALTYFGFGKATGIELPDEAKGLVPTPDWKQAIIGTKWFAGDSINAGIGQGYVLMTPLQLAMGTAMLAEKGLVHQTTLLKLDPSQNLAIEKQNALFQPDEKTLDTWKTVTDAMQGVIINPQGTGWQFGRHPPYSVAAKTGTVQLHGHCTSSSVEDDASLPEGLRCNQMFIAFAPVDHPQVAIAVVIEHGGSASKIARQVIDTYFSLNPNQPLKTTKISEVHPAL